MTVFAKETVSEALERSLRNAKHLRAKDAAAVAAARALAWKIDNWSKLADAAISESGETGARPKLPLNDNVSISSFLKYMEALGLTPTVEAAKPSVQAVADDDRPAKRRKSDFELYREQFG